MRRKHKIPLAIVMPAFNEEACIEASVNQWLNVATKLGGVMIVVNDGSRDRTGEILESLQERHPRLLRVIHQGNAGQGAALRTGYYTALYWAADYIFQTDSDMQFSADDFWMLWERRVDSPFILGSREKRFDSPARKRLAQLMRRIAMRLFTIPDCDFNVPYRLMESNVLRQLLEMIPPGAFAPNFHLAVLAKRAAFPTLDLPVNHQARATGLVSLQGWALFKAAAKHVLELWTLKRNLNRYQAALDTLGEAFQATTLRPSKKRTRASRRR